jgi:hypothetical protein
VLSKGTSPQLFYRSNTARVRHDGVLFYRKNASFKANYASRLAFQHTSEKDVGLPASEDLRIRTQLRTIDRQSFVKTRAAARKSAESTPPPGTIHADSFRTCRSTERRRRLDVIDTPSIAC